MALIEFKEITKSFGKKEVLKGVSFKVEEGDLFGLAGMSGGGKTTLFNILTGLLKQDSGKIILEKKQIKENIKKLKQNIGFATQSNMIFEDLTLRENCLYFGSLYGMKKKKILEKMKELTGLLSLEGSENTITRNLSGGMAKRANLLVSIIHDPSILILDEPTAGLDPLLRTTLWGYIRELNKNGSTIIISSHLIDELERECKRVAFLKGGTIAAIATPTRYKEHYHQKSLRDVFNLFYQDETI